jgi:hypothetical protein
MIGHKTLTASEAHGKLPLPDGLLFVLLVAKISAI